LKILFSPSEGKTQGGYGDTLNSKSFIFESLYDTRIVPAQHYQSFIDTASTEELKTIFGTKNEKVVARYKNDIFSLPTKKAMNRYEGVAYDYLQYASLDHATQAYIDHNVIIFSNIFGPIGAGDMIPEYKFKQGSKLPDFQVEKYFKEHFSDALDDYLRDDIIDLRAGFYEKFYTVKAPFLTFKFLKEGKVVSHWAKAYRGIILKTLAEKRIETIEQFMKTPVPGLNLVDIKKVKNKTEILFEITS
jgi:cytoplasmic iron level regulating protein YaaA (DUF328/UPF0246 family)